MTRWSRTNFRGRTVSLAGGPAAIVLLAIGADRATLIAVLGAGLAGLFDDLYGDRETKGLAGHLRALARGRVTSGALKILGIGAAAMAAAIVLDGVTPRAAATAVVIAGCANLVNLFDLRPGRALKVVLVVALPLAAWRLAVVALLLIVSDLRERTMLGDAGANALGAAVGVALAQALPPLPVAAAVVAVTLVSERVSFSRVIEASPPLRWLDGLGRLA